MAFARRSRNWIWFFLTLVLLTILGVSLETWFNLSQQLKPERVAAARRLWEEKGPRDYALEYSLRRKEGEAEKYIVTVREGKAIAATGGQGQRLSATAYPFAAMEDLFRFIEKQLAEDSRPGSPRAFVTAAFAPEDGRVLRYVRSVRATSERLEILVTVRPAFPAGADARDG